MLPLQLLPNVDAIVNEITNNVLTKISQKSLPDLPEPVKRYSHWRWSRFRYQNYFEDDYIDEIIPETPNEQQQIPQELLRSLTSIGSTLSPPPQGEELLPEINQANKREAIIIDDSDMEFNIAWTTNGVEIKNDNDDNNEVRFVKQTLQHPKDGLARMIRNEAPTIEIDADVLEQYPSFTADINIDETDKNIKQEEVFDRLINQLPPDKDTVYIDHDKNITNLGWDEKRQIKTLRKNRYIKKKVKTKAQGHVMDVIYRPGKRKSKRKPKNPQRNPPDKKTGFMHERTEKQ